MKSSETYAMWHFLNRFHSYLKLSGLTAQSWPTKDLTAKSQLYQNPIIGLDRGNNFDIDLTDRMYQPCLHKSEYVSKKLVRRLLPNAKKGHATNRN